MVAADAQATSIYTDLSGNECRTIKEDKETGSSIQRCPGVAGYHLIVADDDSRMSVSVVTPDNKEHPVDYWNVIAKSFSSLGKKAEWRVVKAKGAVTPIALIVRVDASDQTNLESPKTRSYLAVAKIHEGEICVTDKIKPAKNANEAARHAADDAINRPCLKP